MDKDKQFQVVWLNSENALSFKAFMAPDYLSCIPKKTYYGIGLLMNKTAVGAALLNWDKNSDTLEIFSILIHPDYRNMGGGAFLKNTIFTIAERIHAGSVSYRYSDPSDPIKAYLEREGFDSKRYQGESFLFSRKALGTYIKDPTPQNKIFRKSEAYFLKVFKKRNSDKYYRLERIDNSKWLLRLYFHASLNPIQSAGLLGYAMKEAYNVISDDDTLQIFVPEQQIDGFELLFKDSPDIGHEFFYVMYENLRRDTPMMTPFAPEYLLLPRINTLSDYLADIGLEGELLPCDPDEMFYELAVDVGQLPRYLHYKLILDPDGEGTPSPRFHTTISTVFYAEDTYGIPEIFMHRHNELLSTAVVSEETGTVVVSATMPEGEAMPREEDYKAFFTLYEQEISSLYGVSPLLPVEAYEPSVSNLLSDLSGLKDTLEETGYGSELMYDNNDIPQLLLTPPSDSPLTAGSGEEDDLLCADILYPGKDMTGVSLSTRFHCEELSDEAAGELVIDWSNTHDITRLTTFGNGYLTLSTVLVSDEQPDSDRLAMLLKEYAMDWNDIRAIRNGGYKNV